MDWKRSCEELLGELRAWVAEPGRRPEAPAALIEELEASFREIESEAGVYRALIDEFPEALLLSDVRGTIRWANRAASVLLGAGRQELLGRSLNEWVRECVFLSASSGGRELQGRSLSEWMQEGEWPPVPGDFRCGKVRFVDGSGEPREVHGTVVALPGRVGETAALAWILRDRQQLEPVELAGKPGELWYYTLAEAARDAIFVIGKEGRVLYVNRAAAQMVGRPPEELLGNRPEALFGSFARQRENLERVFRTGAPLFVEDEMEFPDRKCWLETSLAPLLGRDGRVEAVLGVSRDVTDRKRAEEALHRSEVQYRTTIDALADPIHVVDRDLRVVLCNQALRRWVEALGLGPEIVGRPLFELFPFLRERIREEYEEVFRTGRPILTQEEMFLMGRRFITETHKIPIVQDGTVIQVVTLVHDVTEPWEAEQVLRASEERYRTLVETSPDAIVLTDLEGRVLMANRRAAALWGANRAEELVGKDGFELLAPQDRDRLEAAIQRVLERGTLQGLEYTLLPPTGKPVPVELSLSLVQDGAGRPTGFLAVAHDLTERKRLEAQFLQAQKMETLGRLAGGIAHDFNNLLTALQGYATLAGAALPPEHPARGDLEQVLRIVDRGGRLTRQLLAFARRQALEAQVLDLNEVVGDLERMLKRLVGEAIEFRVALDPEPCLVRADRSQLEQAIVNLVVNARDAMPHGGRLTLETKRLDLDAPDASAGLRGPYVRLRVVDTGAGMDKEVQAHLFEPFFTTKGSGEGTGLGLATVLHIVRRCQGQIVVSSEPGQGSTFDIYLPRADGQAAFQPLPESEVPMPTGHETVLLVEDDAAVREFLSRMLRALGYRVLEAASGEEAVRLASAEVSPIDLVLSDFLLPGMDGEELAREVRRRWPGLRVLYLSGYGEECFRRRGLEGAAFLCKPFAPQALARKLREVLDAPPCADQGAPREGKG